ncbi:DNA polymerase phi family protein [Clavispora lusitaniae]|uniref:DNA polymerase phi family protein n=1 Tax=Clavispora lusitaniae TaxID=36911 RepID=UPI00202C09E6|nr:DNA polymerase phi family protein [Clavispora lusitaniae]
MSVSRDYYYKLSSEIPQERIEAATGLLSELSAVNKKEEWDYALGRLIKGLSTSRQTARFGFSMALTELVRELVLKEDYDLSISSMLDKIVDATQVSSSMKGKELRSVLFGRLFGFQALVNSELLLQKESSSQEDLQKFVRLLVELSGTKSWLRESAMFTMCQFLGSFLNSDMFSEDTLVTFLQVISDQDLTFTTEGLAVYLVIPQPLRSRVAQKVTGVSLWKNGDPLSSGNLQVLAKVMKDVDVVSDESSEEAESSNKKNKNSKQKGTWSPRLPFAWEYLVKHFAAKDSDDDSEEIQEEHSKKRKKSGSSSSKKKAKSDTSGAISFKEFWKVVVDETMFAEKSSSERKYWGFEVFMKFISVLPANLVEFSFTPNFMRCLINQSALQNRLLNKISTKAINTIIEVSQADLSKVVPFLKCLINEKCGGSWNFDPMTKSKVTDALVGVLGYVEDVNSVSDSQVDELVNSIKEVLVAKFDEALASQIEPENTDVLAHKKSNDNILKWVLDKQLVLIRSTKRFKASKSKSLESIFKFLIQHSFFKAKNAPSVSSNILKLIQDRLNSFLSEVILSKRKEHSWSFYCVKQIKKLEDNDKFELVLELDSDLNAIKEDGLEMINTIKDAMKRDQAHKDQQYCFELLFSMVLIQLYMGEAETVDVLQELKDCYVETFSGGKEENDSSVTMTEIILSFVSRKSSLLKKLSTIVWESLLCAKGADGRLMINDACFDLLFAILKTKENEEGQNALFEGEDEFNAASEDDDNDEDKENDVEDQGEDQINAESDVESNKSITSESESDADDEDEGETDADDNIEKKTNIKLAKALGIPTESSGEVKFDEIDSFGEDGDDYESESMDDEQMMAIDDELSRIFVERRNALSANSTNKKKAEMLEAKENITLFKSRVLDLLEAFSKEQPNSIYNLSFIKPIITLMNSTKDKNLGMKAHKLLKTRISKTRITLEEFAQLYETEEEKSKFKKTQIDTLEWLQLQAGKYSSNQAHASACGQSCIIISKALVSFDSSLLETIINIYTRTLLVWATESKNRIQASMFFDFINWLNSKRSNHT